MAKFPIPSPELLRQIIRYEPETGLLFWLERAPDSFEDNRQKTAAHRCAIWNATMPGRRALANELGRGYLGGFVSRRQFKAHRVAWALHYGRWPTGDLDHINGDPGDNRIENLREVDRSTNNHNLRRPSDNVSGHAGVSWSKTAQKWHAYINHCGKRHQIGFFGSIEDAVSARKAAAHDLGFTKRHGTDPP